jgi:hypothetical protein
MAFQKYPGKRYRATVTNGVEQLEDRYITSADQESPEWVDSPKKAAAAARAPKAKADKADKPKE